VENSADPAEWFGASGRSASVILSVGSLLTFSAHMCGTPDDLSGCVMSINNTAESPPRWRIARARLPSTGSLALFLDQVLPVALCQTESTRSDEDLRLWEGTPRGPTVARKIAHRRPFQDLRCRGSPE